MSLYNCLIFFLIEGQSPREEVRRDAQTKYSQCLHILYEFSQLWISASLTHRLFETLQAHMQISQPVHSGGALSSSASTSSVLAAEPFGTPVPGLRVSSDITMSHFREYVHFKDDCVPDPKLTAHQTVGNRVPLRRLEHRGNWAESGSIERPRQQSSVPGSRESVLPGRRLSAFTRFQLAPRRRGARRCGRREVVSRGFGTAGFSSNIELTRGFQD